MKPDLGQIMKQAQEMQEKLQQSQQQLAEMEVIGEAGAGMVKVTMTGKHDVKRVSIDQDLMGEDKEMLEDLLAAAVNDAVRRVETKNQEHMKEMASGLGMPAGFKMPF